MLIRTATEADRLPLFKLCVAMHQETDFRAFVLDPQKTLDSLGYWIAGGHPLASGEAVALVAERDGEPVGFFLGKVIAPWYSAELAGVEDCFYVLPQHRGSRAAFKLVLAFLAWAKDRGAQHVRAGVSSGCGPAGERLYEHFGMKNMGGNFVAHWKE